MVERRELTASMDNVYAWRLGEIALNAGDPSRTDTGDYIDRGLILLRLLNEMGFTVMAEYPVSQGKGTVK